MPSDYLNRVIYLSEAEYQTIVTNGSITKNDVTITYDANDLYITPEARHTLTFGDGTYSFDGTADVTVPDVSGYGKIASGATSSATTALTGNTTIATASSSNEKLTISAANKWIVTAATDTSSADSDVFQIAHSLSGATANSYGDSSNQTPAYGGSFAVPTLTVDAAGHITAISTHNVTIPGVTSATNSTSTTLAATASAVKAAYDLAESNAVEVVRL